MGCAIGPHRLPSADSVVTSVTRPFLFHPKRMQLSGSGSKTTGLLCYRHKIISSIELTTSKQRQRKEGRERWREGRREKRGGEGRRKGNVTAMVGGKRRPCRSESGFHEPFLLHISWSWIYSLSLCVCDAIINVWGQGKSRSRHEQVWTLGCCLPLR